MPMKRCKADEHYYDQNKYSECPYCRKTKKIKKENGRKFDEQIHRADVDPKPPVGNKQGSETRRIPAADDSEHTFEDTPPVVAWLVVVKGPGIGQDFRVISGMNRIGRDQDMTIRINLGDDTISRHEHAVLFYDPLNNVFFIKHGSGQNLTYVNGAMVMDAKSLQAHDRIRVGQTELLFVPLCTEQFQWGQDG